MYESLQYIFAAIMVSSLVALVVKAWHHPQRDALIRRAWADARLVKPNAIRIALAVFVIAYVQGVIGRTLAYYLHHRMVDYMEVTPNDVNVTLKSPRLYDIGHEATPDLSDSTTIRVINEGLQYIMFLALASVFAIPYWLQLLKGQCARVFTANMVTRFLVTLAGGHVMRMSAYVVTSLPGPATHCIVDDAHKPTKLSEIFGSPRIGGNCGDLIFSGHMLTAVTIFCTMQLYVEKIFCRRTSLLFVACFVPLPVWQVVNILMLRAHYTVDIVVAVEVALLFNVVLSRLWWTEDPYDQVIEEADACPAGAENSVSVVIDDGIDLHVRQEQEYPLPVIITVKDKEADDSGMEPTTDETSGNGVTPMPDTPVARSSRSLSG